MQNLADEHWTRKKGSREPNDLHFGVPRRPFFRISWPSLEQISVDLLKNVSKNLCHASTFKK